MYATAQRVRREGRDGINAFVFSHASEAFGNIDWEHPDLPLIAREHPGDRRAERVDITPGGNQVLSFLDVVARDDTPIDRIRSAVSAVGSRVTQTGHPERTEGAIPVWFNFAPTERPRLHEVFNALSRSLVELLEGSGSVAELPTPIRILRTMDDDGSCFYQVDSRDLSRVQAAIDPSAVIRPARIHVGQDVVPAFEAIHGPILSHVILAVTALEMDKLRELGGYEVIDGRTGVVLRRWPSPRNPQLPT